MTDKPLILLVDDDPINIQTLTKRLEGTYDICSANNGCDAISQLKKTPPDLIILDVMMPDLSGFDVCKVIRAEEAYADIPILFLTGKDDIEAEIVGLELGGIDYLKKPVNLDLLKLRVRNHLELKKRNDLIKEQRDLLTQQKEELAQLLTEQELRNRQLLETKAALRQSEKMYRTLFEQSPDGIVLWSTPDLRAVQCNTAAQTLHGYSQEEFTSLTVWDIEASLSPDEIANVREVLLRDGLASFDSVHRTKTGELRYMFVILKTIDLEGQSMILDIHRDITERKLAEEALKESEWKFQALFDNGPIGVAYHSMIYDDSGKAVDYKFIDSNDKYIELTGVDPRGKTVLQAFTGIENDPFDWIGTFGTVARTGETIRFESYLQNNDRWYDVVGYQYKPDHFVAAFFEITERKHAQEKLNELMRVQQVILDNTPVGICLIIDRKLLWVNQKMSEILQYSKNELEGQTSQKLYLTQEDYEQLGKDAYPVIAKGQQFETTRELRRRDGSPIWVRYNGRAVAPPDMSKGTVWILEDISEQRSMEEQLRQAQKMESVGRLAGGVAHDFNNLLTVILGGVYLSLMEVDPSQPLHDHIMSIKKAAEKSAELTQQLLAFARRQTIMPKKLNLNMTAENMIKILQRLIGEAIELSWQPEADLWPVKADPSQIDQILANLCVNARDSISNTGKITIQTGNSVIDEGYRAEHADFTPGEYVHISVCDNGCGMDKETLAQIFEPFFTTKGVGEGTGMGLATVYGIVKQNNGFINVYSEPGMGTTFTIYLPRYVGNSDQAVPKGQMQPAPRGLETILLVEDEPSILNMTVNILTNQGYTVLAANGPGEATRLAGERSGEIDLLITDVVMPEMNGKDLANKLMALYPELKCLYMSGYPADVIAHHGVLDEGVHFIQKPYSLPDLAAKVREALG